MEDPRPEISDLIIDYEPGTLRRVDVRKSDVLAKLESLGMSRSVSIVRTYPASNDVLDADFVDRLLVRTHMELQRLSEEFQQGHRMLRLLAPMLDAFRARGVEGLHVVDVGCGPGFIVRWLSAEGGLGADVTLSGCDYNAALVKLAKRLAKEEHLACSFHHENAFTLERPATVYLSTGVVHHFRGEGLAAFFAEQRERALGFIHCDIKPTYLAGIGAWIFHRARMREPLARHDGVLSALRAHSAERLREAASKGAGDFRIGTFDSRRERLPVLHVMQALVGVREEHADAFIQRLGPLAERIEWT